MNREEAVIINVEELSEQLRQNPDLIIKVLIKLNFPEDKIKYHASKQMITSPRPDPSADNLFGYIIYTNSLNYICTTRSSRGNIYSLVMDMKKVSFPKALSIIAGWINYTFIDEQIIRPFGGFYKGLSSTKKILDTELKKYDRNILPKKACNLRFFKDGISYATQEKFDLRFDLENNAILIPITNIQGDLIGCKARKNEDVLVNKYWAEIPFQKSSVVYGLSQNYKYIVKKSKIIVLEAEKSVMQCSDFGCNIASAIMSHDISASQATIIKSLMCDEVIIAFDEGVTLQEIRKACAQVYVNNSVYHNKVFYLYGGLPKGSKASPSDFGIDTFKKLFKENIFEYKENYG